MYIYVCIKLANQTQNMYYSFCRIKEAPLSAFIIVRNVYLPSSQQSSKVPLDHSNPTSNNFLVGRLCCSFCFLCSHSHATKSPPNRQHPVQTSTDPYIPGYWSVKRQKACAKALGTCTRVQLLALLFPVQVSEWVTSACRSSPSLTCILPFTISPFLDTRPAFVLAHEYDRIPLFLLTNTHIR